MSNPIHHSSDEEASYSEYEIPEAFVCPLTLEIMKDPLMDRRGINFERKAIVEWLNRGNHTCPLTREPLSYSKLIPNAALRLKIKRWKQEHGLLLEPSASKSSSTAIKEDYGSEKYPEFLCMIEAPANSMMEVRLNHQIISSLLVNANRQIVQRPTTPTGTTAIRQTGNRRFMMRRTYNQTLSPASRRRSLISVLDSALSAVRRSPAVEG
jgi:hypothetical protein